MKTFRDDSNSEWTVFEVRREVSARGDWSYLPSGYSDGWLCFESGATKRRLTRYPANWRELPDSDLSELLVRAQPAPRAAFRNGDDFGDDSRASDVRAE